MAANQRGMFVASTFETLSQDVTRGGGEHLTALATLMGVPVEHHTAFFAMAQQHYRGLVDTGEGSSVAVVKALQDAMNEHRSLLKYRKRSDTIFI